MFSSDLRRAVETAEIAFAGTPMPLRQDARLRECNYGEMNGCPVEQLHAQRAQRVDTPFPGGQSYRDVVEQTREFMRDLSREYDGKRVLLIAHSANRWALQHLLEGTPLEEVVVAPFEWHEGWEYTLAGRLERRLAARLKRLQKLLRGPGDLVHRRLEHLFVLL